MKINELSKDKLDKLASFKTDEEIKAFVENEDIELDPEQLAAVSGGFGGPKRTCQYCGNEVSSMFFGLHVVTCPSNPKEIQSSKAMSSGMAMGMGLADK